MEGVCASGVYGGLRKRCGRWLSEGLLWAGRSGSGRGLLEQDGGWGRADVRAPVLPYDEGWHDGWADCHGGLQGCYGSGDQTEGADGGAAGCPDACKAGEWGKDDVPL